MTATNGDGASAEPVPVPRKSSQGALRVAAVLTLVGLGLMAWSMLVPTPLPVMLAMTVGQAFGTVAFGLYIYIVVRELRKDLKP